jgi:ankyrin repeat protein
MEHLDLYFELIDAIEFGDLSAVDRFIKYNREYASRIKNAKNLRGESFVYMAVANNDHMMVAHLIDHGFDFTSIKEDNGNSPLSRAIIFNRISCAEVLLRNGADPNRMYLGGAHPIHIAANFITFGFDMLKLLVKYGANVNTILETPKGNLYSPLEIVLSRNIMYKRDAACILLKARANPNQVFSKGASAIHYAATMNDVEFIRILLDFKADINQKLTGGNHKGSTPLYIASYHGNNTVIAFLLDNSADKYIKNCLDESAAEAYYRKGHKALYHSLL